MKSPYAVVSLIFMFVITACAPQSALPTRTVAPQPTPTDSPSPTAIPATATDSATDLPETTPSPIPTLPILPTLTAAIAAGGLGAYHLAPQTADQADENIARIEQMIPTLDDNPQADQEDLYPPHYRAVWYAAWDALAHFPNDPRAESWRWKMARYMALSGDIDEAHKTYSDLITSILNTGHVPVDDLPNHVLLGNTQDSLFAPSFVMQIKTISVPHTNSSFILTIGNLNHPDTPIAACFLLTENDSKYAAYFIEDSFVDFGYSIMRRDSIDCSPKDVTDDGIDEIVTNRYSGGHSGGFTFHVFDTTALPPKAIPFITDQTENPNVVYSSSFVQEFPKIDGKTQIHLEYSNTVPDCYNYRNEYYQWTGKSFELANQDFHFGLPPNSDLSAFCVDDALGGIYNLDAKDAANFLEQAIQAYRPYASRVGDILDELIIQQGIYYALQGEQEKARSTITEVIDAPVVKDSVWTEPAKNFLALYQQPADLYRASSVLISCTPYRDLENGPGTCAQIPLYDTYSVINYTLTSLYPSTPLDQVTATLKKIGVNIAAQGWFDFDQDQKKELWFTIQMPQDKDFELWIVAASPSGNTIFEAGYPEPNVPQPTFRVERTTSHPFLINIGNDTKIELLRDPKTLEPTMNLFDAEEVNRDEYETPIYANLAKFRQLRQELFSGNDPLSVYDQMLEIDRQSADCPFKYDADKASTGVFSDYYDCTAFYYTLAFSAELAGKDADAVKRYYAVWSVYPDSPFAILARLKLEK